MADKPIQQEIKVYCRLRPLRKHDIAIKHKIVNIDGFDRLNIKYTNYRNSRCGNKFVFQFNKVFGEHVSQRSVFENVAVPIVDKFLSGINGTIFTYGQTCSGKTHTVMGSKEEPGILPRTIDYVMKKSTSEFPKVYEISYIQIYNEIVHDLLPLPKDKSKPVKNKDISFTKTVKFIIDDEQRDISFKNLNIHCVTTVSEALELIELGNMNRKISSTTMNIQSSRSHCICTISFYNTTDRNSSAKNKTKLNLVDLAGSERNSKLIVDKKTSTESCSINLSLLHLNNVINILASPNRQIHVPFRNSTITSILKGSLGCDCATAMIATIVLNKEYILETLSTCRFSKQVAAVKKFKKGTSNTNSNRLSMLPSRLQKLEICWQEEKILRQEEKTLFQEEIRLCQEEIRLSKERVEYLEKQHNEDQKCNCRLERNNLGCIEDGIIGVPEVDVMAPLVTEPGDSDLHSMTKVIFGNGARAYDELGLNYETTDVDSIVPAPDGNMAQEDIRSYRRQENYVYSNIAMIIIMMAMFMSWCHEPDGVAVHVFSAIVNTSKHLKSGSCTVLRNYCSSPSCVETVQQNVHFGMNSKIFGVDIHDNLQRLFGWKLLYCYIIIHFILITVLLFNLFISRWNWWKNESGKSSNDKSIINPCSSSENSIPTQLPDLRVPVLEQHSYETPQHCCIILRPNFAKRYGFRRRY